MNYPWNFIILFARQAHPRWRDVILITGMLMRMCRVFRDLHIYVPFLHEGVYQYLLKTK